MFNFERNCPENFQSDALFHIPTSSILAALGYQSFTSSRLKGVPWNGRPCGRISWASFQLLLFLSEASDQSIFVLFELFVFHDYAECI